MKIALLGYGKEGKSAENYFKSHFPDATFDIFEDFTHDDIIQQDFSSYDYVFRSPSVQPLDLPNETSITKYFFEHCPCTIIGVTATKGKGTICSFIKSLLDAHRENAYLIGNIGTPALDILDNLTERSVVIYEMSSFQLWDLNKSPHIAVLGHLEPDHLNVHTDYKDYLNAKANITSHQTSKDFLVFNQNNTEAVKIAITSKATKVAYPFNDFDNIEKVIKDSVTLPGRHNQENAMAAIATAACYYNISPDEYLREKKNIILAGISSFHGLPHRLEFLRELDGIKIYDDNFATNLSSTRVAINAFKGSHLTVIVGGRDKTDYEDLPELYEILKSPQVKHIILIGESGHELAKKYRDPRFHPASSLAEAVNIAVQVTRNDHDRNFDTIVLMSPAAASFDMFKDVYDRGAQFQRLVERLN
ncbi:UDP-N-acetylmuramoyl-L-alanine--D-glutamate ligase [Candidatus Saccharibacteria bacterium]|nr:UDP-N-acetylmuramoyl-L-alanine--D-glutamate ligase [Candidatus Saccharibacteria bacterium]